VLGIGATAGAAIRFVRPAEGVGDDAWPEMGNPEVVRVDRRGIAVGEELVSDVPLPARGSLSRFRSRQNGSARSRCQDHPTVHTREAARAAFDALGATTVLKRVAEPGEIAEVIVFLASSRASYLTGAVIDADGGRTAT
jgi:hypothetical protein